MSFFSVYKAERKLSHFLLSKNVQDLGVLCYFTRKRLPSILFTRRTKYFYRVKIICQPLSDILSTLYYLLLKCLHYILGMLLAESEHWKEDKMKGFTYQPELQKQR